VSDWPEIRRAAEKGQAASYRGVAFHVLADEDNFSHALAVHEFPHRAGAEVEDLGRGAARFNLRCIFFRENYPNLRPFLAALHQTGPGTLEHPFLGSRQVVVGQVGQTHEAPKVRWAELAVEFVAHEPSGQTARLLPSLSPSGLAARAQSRVETGLTSARSQVSRLAHQASQAGLAAQRQARRALGQVTSEIQRRTGVAITLPSGAGSWIDAPVGFCDQVADTVQERARTVIGAPGSVGANFRLFTNELEDMDLELSGLQRSLPQEGRRFLRMAGTAAAVRAAGELIQAGLALEDGNPFSGEYLGVEAQPAEEESWA